MGLFEGSQTVLQISENLSIAFSHPLHGRWAWLHSSPPLSLGSILCGRLEYSLCASYPNLATFCTFYLSSPECALWRLLTSGMAPDGPRVRPECTPCAHGPERAFPPLRVRHVRHVRHVRRVRSPIKKSPQHSLLRWAYRAYMAYMAYSAYRLAPAPTLQRCALRAEPTHANNHLRERSRRAAHAQLLHHAYAQAQRLMMPAQACMAAHSAWTQNAVASRRTASLQLVRSARTDLRLRVVLAAAGRV